MLYGIVEFLGWFGAVTVLAGYLLFSLGKIPNGPVYQALNLVGGVSVAVNVAAHHAVPSTIVNGIWAVIAAVVLARMAAARIRTRRSSSAGSGVVDGSSDGTAAGVVPAPAVRHAEPPTTTAVLPVVGPAVRDHAHAPDAVGGHLAAATDLVGAAPSLPSGHLPAAPVPAGAGARLPAVADHEQTGAGTDEATTPACSGTGTDEATTQAAPLTESVPVITATIALALVAAARGQAERADHADHADHTDHADQQQH